MATNAIASGHQIRRVPIIKLSFGLASLVLLSFVSTFCAAAATPQADIPDSPSRSFILSYVVKVPASTGNRRVRAWIPLPATDDFQTISQLQFQAPAGIHVRTYSGPASRYACFTGEGSSAATPFRVRVTLQVTRYERSVDLTTPIPGLPPDFSSAASMQAPFPADVSQFLRPDKWTQPDQRIASISHQQTAEITDPVQKARRLFEYVVAATGHDDLSLTAKHSDGAKACDSHGSDCTSFNSLFISLARAAGIPARLEIGFAFPDGQKVGSIPGYHCWAEFYVTGIGWIPLDASRARQEPAKRDEFFGTIDARRVMISSVSGEIPFAPGLSAGQFDHLVDPYIEIDGKPYSAYSADLFFQETSLDGPIPSKKKIYARASLPKPDRDPDFPS